MQLSIEEQTGRPYFRLPPPHDRIIIAAPSLQDAPQIPELMNDPRIYRWVLDPPFPYLTEHAVSWLAQAKTTADAVWKELEEASAEGPDGPLKIVGGCPVRSILEENEDGSYTFLGDCGFFRSRFEDIMDDEERTRLVEENNARLVGDPDIIWAMGNYLKPSHHGRGIMTAVVGSLLRDWGIPRMNIHCVRPTALEGNTGSVRVFEKNGFVQYKTVADCIRVAAKADLVGGLRAVHFLEWRRCDDAFPR